MTPVLLQSDATTRRALGRSGALGQNMTIHPAVGLRAVMPYRLNSFSGVPQGYAVEEFHDEGMLMESAFLLSEQTAGAITLVGKPFMELMAAYDRHSCFGFLVEDKGNGSVRPGPGGRPLIHYNLADRDVARLQRGGIVGSADVPGGGGRASVNRGGPTADDHQSAGDRPALGNATPRPRL